MAMKVGSVYFDTKAFKDAEHVYRKLVPPAENADARFESTGGRCIVGIQKTNEYDFALEAGKPGEPTWSSGVKVDRMHIEWRDYPSLVMAI